jgi:glucose-1-phosphatase
MSKGIRGIVAEAASFREKSLDARQAGSLPHGDFEPPAVRIRRRPMIHTFLFDMGNVLVHFCHERMCRQLADVCGTDTAEMRAYLFDEGVLAEFECGRLSESQLHRRLEQRYGRTLGLDDLISAGSDIFTLNESIVPLLDSLKSGGYRLVLLSNTSISHLQWVQRQWSVLEPFDHLVTSYQAGATKPDRAIYEAALQAAQCEPGECFYTDDIPAYIEAARRLGIDAEVYTDTPTLRQHLIQRGIDV